MYELRKNNVLFNLALLSTQQSTPNVTYFNWTFDFRLHWFKNQNLQQLSAVDCAS